MTGGQFALALASGGVGFVLADGLDRFLATYNPDPTKADPKGPPKDKFTSDGAGTLANTLNLAASPNLYRIGAGIGMTALPVVASMFVKQPLLRSSLEGFAIGAGVKLFSLFWNNVVMGHLLTPKDTSVGALQKSVIARLYPAEIAAGINQKQQPPQTAVSSSGSGALSDQPQVPQMGIGAPDVGPFALAGSSEYPDAAQALRNMTGVHDQFSTLQNVWGTGGPGGAYGGSGWGTSGPGSNYPTAAQAMGVGDIFSDMTRTVQSVLPGLAPQQAMQAASSAMSSPQQVTAALQRALPHVPVSALNECARHLHPHVRRLHTAMLHGVGADPATADATAAAATAPLPATPAAASVPAPVPVPTQVIVPSPQAYSPGPPPGPGPGPQATPHKECGCVGDLNLFNSFLGYAGDEKEKAA